MSTKGMPVVACRHLADVVCGTYGIPLLVLHDFDKAGFSIFGTLDGNNNWDKDRVVRYEYAHDFAVIDLRLRLPDVRAYEFESEPVHYKSDPSYNLADNGATPEEIKFLCEDRGWCGKRGRRVDLNAFTSADFIQWIEGKLKANGIRKVIPDGETLSTVNAWRVVSGCLAGNESNQHDRRNPVP